MKEVDNLADCVAFLIFLLTEDFLTRTCTGPRTQRGILPRNQWARGRAQESLCWKEQPK
jgi:hypothetical protein